LCYMKGDHPHLFGNSSIIYCRDFNRHHDGLVSYMLALAGPRTSSRRSLLSSPCSKKSIMSRLYDDWRQTSTGHIGAHDRVTCAVDGSVQVRDGLWLPRPLVSPSSAESTMQSKFSHLKKNLHISVSSKAQQSVCEC